MKNVVLAALLIATVAFAGLYLNQTGKYIKAQTSVESLQQQVGELQSTVQDQEKKSAKLRTELEQVRTDAAGKDREIIELKTASANPALRAAGTVGSSPKRAPVKSSNPFSSLSKMFEDPEMKDAIVAQQRAALGPMIDKTYGQLFAQLKLTPEQASSLKEMLLNKQLAGAQMGMAMLSEGSDPSKAAEMGQKVKAATEAADAEIKTFLGDEKYTQLKDYEKTAADRMAISGFKDQLSSSAAMTPEQEQQLVEMMTQARQNFKFTTDFSDKSKLTGDAAAMFSEDNVNKFIQEMDQLNQHFVTYAQNILTPDQLQSYQKYLNNQQALQKVGMQMGAKMFAPKKDGE